MYTTAGEFDVITLVRARSLEHFREVIHRLRASGRIVGTQERIPSG